MSWLDTDDWSEGELAKHALLVHGARSSILIGCPLCLLLVAALPGKLSFFFFFLHLVADILKIVSWHWKRTHTLQCSPARKSNSNTSPWNHLSPLALVQTRPTKGWRQILLHPKYFQIGWWQSGAVVGLVSVGRWGRHTQPPAVSGRLCASVCEVNKLLRPCYQADDGLMGWIKSLGSERQRKGVIIRISLLFFFFTSKS